MRISTRFSEMSIEKERARAQVARGRFSYHVVSDGWGFSRLQAFETHDDLLIMANTPWS